MAAAAAAAATNLNLWGILLESKRIINAHSRHFLALSVVFLLPLSFSLIVSPFLFPLLSPHHSSQIHILLRQTLPQPQPQPQTLAETPPPLLPFPFSLPLLFFFLFVVFFSLFALASITHSVFHGFFGRPVKLLPALLSILTSFLPLLATSFLTHLLLLSLSLPTIFLFSTASSSPILLAISAVLVLFAVVYLRVSWTLAPVVAVVESTWGLQPLRRSADLTKGMRPLAASCFLFFASMQALLLWTASVDGWAWKDWAFVVQIVLTSTLLMLLMLYNAAADTVLYMYCKAVHGELALEIAEEFAWQYVCLPFDDGKVPHVVSVVRV